MDTNNFTQKKALFEGFSLFAILVLMLVVILTSLSTSSPIFLVLVGFSPTLITIISCILVYEEMSHYKVVIWFIPFILSALFFLILTSQQFAGYNLKVGTLAGINMFLSIVYLAIFFLFFGVTSAAFSRRKKHPKVVHHHHVKSEQQNLSHQPVHAPQPIQQTQVPQPQSIREFVASIEDKSKAINFVIGRVYNKYHGGSKELREKLSINKEWYNEFSEIIQDEGKEAVDEIKNPDKLINLLYVVNKIQERLELANKSEEEVFGIKHLNLKNLERHAAGNDLIIDVMKKNDKDPIDSYYKGALQFCSALKTKLNAMIKK